MNIDVLSASAGTGKTYRLAMDLVAELVAGSAKPEGVVAITYTVKAAGELESRIRASLLSAGKADLAARIRDGYIGTIHSVCQRLLREFALEAGISPFLEPIPETERQRLFDVALAGVLRGREPELNKLARRLAMDEWKGILRKIVDRARDNGMEAAAIVRSAEASRGSFVQLLPPATLDRTTYQRRFRAELDRVIPHLDAEAQGDNASARGRAAQAHRAAVEAGRYGLPSWKDQVQLASAIGLKKLEPVAGGLVSLVAEHTACEAFREDLLAMQEALFQLAGLALTAFEAEKAVARVVDFGDMLARARDLLRRPAVEEALRARLDLVLVDEFQDTSPLQLAVVTTLGRLATRSIWVGDRKQAIFGFQGSDPDLMTSTVTSALGGRAPTILGTSYRSRPPLVAMTSELFARALEPEPHHFPRAEVVLAPEKPDPKGLAQQAPFECWRWTPEKVEGEDGTKISATEPHALAAGIAALLAKPPFVRRRVEGGEDELRPATARDVAVLAFSNDRCRKIAEALRLRGIPAHVSLDMLAATPEGILVCSALALIADPADGVAALRLGWLGGRGASNPDGWLSGRFAEVALWRKEREEAETKGARAPSLPLPFSDDPRVAALRGAAATASRLSPAEALDLALRAGDLIALLRRWPEPGQRLANVEAFRAEAKAYEELCGARRTAATVLGLVDHFAHLGDVEDSGKQAAPADEDAVTVSTWHKAKGLEWPVVVLGHLDHERERSVFEVAVEPAEKFDFGSPLAGRWVRYWPFPYGGMSKGLAFLEAAEKQPEAVQSRAREVAERLRLLYVGFTRARDLLIFAAKVSDKKGPALSKLGPLTDQTGQPLIALPFESPDGQAELAVGKAHWPCGVKDFSGLPPDVEAPPRSATTWYAAATPVVRPREIVNPSGESLPGSAHMIKVSSLGSRQKLSAKLEDMGSVGDAIHAFLAADRGGDLASRIAMATRLLKGYGVVGAVDPKTLLEASDALRAFLEARYPGATSNREWPVRARLPGVHPRLLVGEVDLFLELPTGFVLVDHKSFPGSAADRDRRLSEEWAPQLAWYARVLEKALKKPLLAAYVHLPIRGEMAEVAITGDYPAAASAGRLRNNTES